MKKILALVLALAMVLSFAACGKKNDTDSNADAAKADYKLGMGVSVSLDGSADKTADKEAKVKAEATVATVVFDKDGKVVAIAIDCAETEVEVKDGKLVNLDKVDLRTKYEKKFDYNMVNYQSSPIGKEWFEQVDALEKWCVGKTAAEIASSAATNADLAAGCTIGKDAFLDAIAKAATDEQAVSFAATTLKLGLDVDFAVTGNDKNDKGDATVKFAPTIGATVVDAEGKTLAAIIDELEATVSVTDKGIVSSKDYKDTKRNLKENYNMVNYQATPIGKEWYEQADALADYVVGKTAAEITAIPTKAKDDGSVVLDVEALAASCTIKVGSYIKVLANAATIAD